ncbi:MAG: acyl carrier protein [Clostridia bacterium]|nr:acyl carrier protein [Clostridia bacterium]
MLEKIIEVLSEYTDVDPKTITEKTNLRNDLALDSLQLINLSGALEDEFDVTISDRDAMNIQTVGDVLRFIEEQK